MQVKIAMPRFEAVADLSGAEVEVLNRVFAKLKTGDEQYLESKYVFVSHDVGTPPDIKMDVSPGLVVMSVLTYRTAKDAQKDREAKAEAEAKAARAALVQQITTADFTFDGRDAAFKALIALLTDQSHLYYKEPETASLAIIEDASITISTVSSNSAYTISIINDGTMTRTKV